MNSISHACNVATTSFCIREQSSPPGGKLKSCISRVSCTHYSSIHFSMTSVAIGHQAGKHIATFLKNCGNGYDTAAIGRQEGRCIAATLRKQGRHVSFSQ